MRDVVRIFVSFISFYFRYIISHVHWSYDHLVIAFIVLIFDIYIYICIYDDVVIMFYLSLHVLFIFFLYTYVSYMMYAILYFCFTLRCLNEFCLKCFRNTGCQSLLAINSFLAKFFKSLCKDRFYCIQQVNMS